MPHFSCKDCRHFRQHYVLGESVATAVNCGHCVTARHKHRAADADACPNFQRGSRALPDRDGVVRFLTTSLLEYILSLPLPPDIDRG